MSIKNKLDGIKSIMTTAIMTGIALVIANSWGAAIRKTVSKIVDRVKCAHFLTTKNKGDYKSCQERQGLLSLYINALVTSVLLSIIAFLLFGKRAVKRIK